MVENSKLCYLLIRNYKTHSPDRNGYPTASPSAGSGQAGLRGVIVDSGNCSKAIGEVK